MIANLMQENWRGLSFETDIATVYLGLEESDKALEFLEKALEVRDPWLTFSWLALSHFFTFGSIRSNPRYVKIMQKIGLAIDRGQ